MRSPRRVNVTRWQFARLIKTVCVTGAVLFPLVGGTVVTFTAVIGPHEQQARQELAAATASETQVRVRGVHGLCGETAARCGTLGLQVDLPGGQQAVVKWAQGKPYSENITVWQKTNGNWTTKEPRLDGASAWNGVILTALGTVAVATALLVVVLSINSRTWYALSPEFLPEKIHRLPASDRTKASAC